MKDEIKEIKISKSNHSIVIIKNGITVKEQFAIDDEILDYITNLQQENKDLKDELEVINKSACFWEDTSDNYQTRMNNYKSRIDKAIEYIKSIEYEDGFTNKMVYYDEDETCIDLLNILQGSDKDE